MLRFSKAIFTSGIISLTACFGAHAETLDQAMQNALNNHPAIKAAQAGELVTLEDLKAEKSAYYPTASASASFGRIYADNTTTRGLTVSRGAGYSWFGEGSTALSQRLYDFAATSHSVNAAKARNLSAGATTSVQISTIALQAAQTYLQLLRTQELLSMANENLIDITDYYNRIKTAFDNDGADESEVSRAQDFLSLAKNTKLQYTSDVEIAKAAYKEIMGKLPKTDLSHPSVNISQLPKTLDSMIIHALSKHPQITSSNLEVRANEYDIKREKSAFYPELNAELSYSQKDQKDIIGGETTDGRALIRLDWDYAFGGAQSAATRRAASIKQEAEFNLEALKRAIAKEVEIAFITLNLAQDQKQNEKDRLKAAKQTLETYKEQYEGSQRSILDLMTAKNSYFNAQQDFLNVELEELNSAYILLNAIGIPFHEPNTKG